MGFQRVENVEEFDMSRLIYARDYTKIKDGKVSLKVFVRL